MDFVTFKAALEPSLDSFVFRRLRSNLGINTYLSIYAKGEVGGGLEGARAEFLLTVFLSYIRSYCSPVTTNNRISSVVLPG